MVLKDALAQFAYEARSVDWRDGTKTFHAFWTWFAAGEQALREQATAEEMEWLESELEKLTADLDDAGLAVPPECEHDIIP